MADHTQAVGSVLHSEKNDVSLRYRRAPIAGSLPNLRLDKARPHFDGSVPQSETIGVGQPVTRLPPHGSRRAVFPHRALQAVSLPQALLSKRRCCTPQ